MTEQEEGSPATGCCVGCILGPAIALVVLLIALVLYNHVDLGALLP